MKFSHPARLDPVSTRTRGQIRARHGRRFRRPLTRIVALIAVAVIVLFAVTTSLKARSGRALQVLSIGTTWSAGYIVVPQRSVGSDNARRADVANAQLLARQRGLPIVADTDAESVTTVIQKEAGR